mgnify:CR=1 FL=1
MAKAIIATNGNFPAGYNVLQANKDGIYEVVFGEKNGPRMGFFISFFGLKETIKLINDKIR